MKENRYKLPENGLMENDGMVCEPSPAYATAVAPPYRHLSTEMDEDGMESYPYGRSLEQVREHCALFEELRKDSSRWSTWEEVNARLHQKHPWLR